MLFFVCLSIKDKKEKANLFFRRWKHNYLFVFMTYFIVFFLYSVIQVNTAFSQIAWFFYNVRYPSVKLN